MADNSSVAIIPARGGSKRIPGKNIKYFCGKPLIAYSIEAAHNSGLFKEIIVSTDDPDICQIAKSAGATVPFVRPPGLSNDYAHVSEVVEHAIGHLEQEGRYYDYSCTIYPTAPLLQTEYLKEGLEKLKEYDAVHAIAVATMPFPIQRSFMLTGEEGRCKMFFPKSYFKRSQDLVKSYQDAGQFYWKDLNRESKENSLFGEDTVGVVIPRHMVVDIDTFEDWEACEIMYENLQLRAARVNSEDPE
jgi:pseudaminic acid cytidylyltransferase